MGKRWWSLSSLLVIFLVGSCSASYGEKVGHLEEVAQRGVEVHKIIEDLEGEEADEEQCRDASRVLNKDYPSIEKKDREAWHELVEGVFVSACVSGRY